MRHFKIAALPGVGIGHDVIAAGVRVLEALAKRDRTFRVSFDHFDWGSNRYKAVGSFMPEDGAAQLQNYDALYLICWVGC